MAATVPTTSAHRVPEGFGLTLTRPMQITGATHAGDFFVAALYVDSRHTPYRLIDGVDCWPIERDARWYDSKMPVIAHPPCGPHGKYAANCNQDFALAELALTQVRTYRGVLEHPEGSQLAEQLATEQHDLWNGRAFKIDQFRFGHLAQKPTILYFVRPNRIPPIPPPRTRRPRPMETLSRLQRQLTPPELARWLTEAFA